jgi:hypothetical protein
MCSSTHSQQHPTFILNEDLPKVVNFFHPCKWAKGEALYTFILKFLNFFFEKPPKFKYFFGWWTNQNDSLQKKKKKNLRSIPSNQFKDEISTTLLRELGGWFSFFFSSKTVGSNFHKGLKTLPNSLFELLKNNNLITLLPRQRHYNLFYKKINIIIILYYIIL